MIPPVTAFSVITVLAVNTTPAAIAKRSGESAAALESPSRLIAPPISVVATLMLTPFPPCTTMPLLNTDAVVSNVTIAAALVATRVRIPSVSLLLSVTPSTMILPDVELPIDILAVAIRPISSSVICMLPGVPPIPMVWPVLDP